MGPMFSTPAGSEGISSFQSVRCPVHIETVNAGRKFSGLGDVEGAAVGVPGDGLLSLIESCDRAGVAARDGIQISSLVRTDGCNLPGVGRQGKSGSVDSLLRDRHGLACGQFINVEAHAFAGFVRGEQDAFGVGNQCAQLWLILSFVSCFGSPAPVGSSLNWEGDSCDCAMAHLPSGERATAPPSPSRTAGEPLVLRM